MIAATLRQMAAAVATLKSEIHMANPPRLFGSFEEGAVPPCQTDQRGKVQLVPQVAAEMSVG